MYLTERCSRHSLSNSHDKTPFSTIGPVASNSSSPGVFSWGLTNSMSRETFQRHFNFNTLLLSIIAFFAVQTYMVVSDDHVKVIQHEVQIPAMDKRLTKVENTASITTWSNHK